MPRLFATPPWAWFGSSSTKAGASTADSDISRCCRWQRCWAPDCEPQQLQEWTLRPLDGVRNHLDGVCPTGPMSDMSSHSSTPNLQLRVQGRRCFRTGGWCLWRNSGDGAHRQICSSCLENSSVNSGVHNSDAQIRPCNTGATTMRTGSL